MEDGWQGDNWIGLREDGSNCDYFVNVEFYRSKIDFMFIISV